MRTNSRMMTRALTLVVLTGAVGFAERAQAQQTGLFPLAPIRRQRVPCDQEDPTYKVYKQQYFGYHPTCWRTFPEGWGCPSGQRPDVEKSKKDIPPGNTPELGGDQGEGMGGERNPQMERRPERPGIPEGVDPFVETPGAGAPNVAPLPGRGNTVPGRTIPAPGRAKPPAGEDPFQDLNPPGAAMTRPRGGNGARGGSMSAAPADEAPELSAPATPAQGSAYRSRSRTLDADGQLAANTDDRPTLGLPEDEAPAAAVDDSTGDAQGGSVGSYSSANPYPGTSAAATPAPAAQPRRRIFGNLFSSLGSSWTRR
ncbi:MAG: hypothetical protein ACYC61_29320 [Isosphaeraceae bacterium]